MMYSHQVNSFTNVGSEPPNFMLLSLTVYRYQGSTNPNGQSPPMILRQHAAEDVSNRVG